MQLERVQTCRPPHVTTRAGGPGASKPRACAGGSCPSFPPSLLTAVPTEHCLRNSQRRNERHSRSCLSWEEWGKECGLGANLGNTVTSVIKRDVPVGLAWPFVPQTMHGHGPGPGTMGRWTRPGVSGRRPQQATEIW